MRVLLIAQTVAELMDYHLLLTSKGLECDLAKSYHEVQFLITNESYCCILIDANLEIKYSFKISILCKKLHTVPIVYLGIPITLSMLEKFRSFGSDYIQKSWPKQQIWYRIRKSIELFINEPAIITCHTLWIDQIERKVKVGNSIVHLTPLQFDILLYLIKHPDTIHSMEEIYFNVWHKNEINPLETVQVNISRVRRKLLDAQPNYDYISTIRTKGYRFNSNPEVKWQELSCHQ